jgi:hypothetical protein
MISSSSKIFKKYWKEILFFSGYFILLLFASPLDVSQANLGDKSINFLYESISLDISYKNPLYVLLGWLVTRLPFRDSFSMIFFLSIIPAVLTNILVYIIVKKETGNNGDAFIGSLVLSSSSVYFMQAQKIEAYVLVAFFITLGLFLIYYKKFWLSSIVLGLSVLIHPYGIFGFFILASIFLRRKSFIVVGIVLLFYCTMKIITSDTLSYYLQIKNMFLMWNTWSFFFEKTAYIFLSLIMVFSVGMVPFFFFVIDKIRNRDVLRNHSQLIVYFNCCLMIITVFTTTLFFPAPGLNLLAVIIPIFAIIAGMGVQYISYKKIVILGCCIVLVITITNFSIRFKDNINGETYSRRLLNDLSVIDDNSLIIQTKVRDRDNLFFADGIFMEGAIKYNNFLYNKKSYGYYNEYVLFDSASIKEKNNVNSFYYVRAMNDVEEILVKE